MSKIIEIEKTYLLKELPDLTDFKTEYLKDKYLPPNSDHPQIRLRNRGGIYMITKKYPKIPSDLSSMVEETIQLSEFEFNYLYTLEGLELIKTRYSKKTSDYLIEIDVYGGSLEGLIVVDFEFETQAKADMFLPPNYVLAEITDNGFLAAGKLAGKSYSDLASEFTKYGYN